VRIEPFGEDYSSSRRRYRCFSVPGNNLACRPQPARAEGGGEEVGLRLTRQHPVSTAKACKTPCAISASSLICRAARPCGVAHTAAQVTLHTTLDATPLPVPLPLNLLTPSIDLDGNISATPSQNSSTSAGITGTGQWTLSGSPAVLQQSGVTLSTTPLIGSLNWMTQFSLVSNPVAGSPTTVNSLIQFTFTGSGTTNTNTPFSNEQSVTLTCTGTSCAAPSNFNGFSAATDTLDVLVSLAACDCFDLTLSETVTFQSNVTGGQNGSFFFSDPTTLTYLDSDGSTVPNLVLYDSTENGVIGLSGQDFSPGETPIPATFPLFASGLGAMGLLGWRRKRKTAAIAT